MVLVDPLSLQRGRPAKYYKVTVGRKFTCVLDGFSDLNYVGLGG